MMSLSLANKAFISDLDRKMQIHIKNGSSEEDILVSIYEVARNDSYKHFKREYYCT